jgi:ATP-dependent Lon protease
MTGEITLSGLVFPVGGLKEKILAAHRAGIRRIMLPSRNEADIEDLPEDVRKELQIVFVSRISEVIDAALEVLVANPPPPPIVTTSSHPEAVARQPEQTPAPLQVRQS